MNWITTVIKKHRQIIKKHDKIELLAKIKLNCIDVLISKVLVDSYISHDDFSPINNVLKEFDNTKEEIRYPNYT